MLFDQSLIKNFQVWVKQLGLSRAMGKLLETLGLKDIKIVGALPKTGPILVVSNHTGVFDSLILLSKINRPDFFWTALATYRVFGGEVEKRLIPIYRKRRLNHKIYEYPLCLQVNGCLPENLSRQEIIKRNRKSIKLAAGLINQGKVVSIFPTGAGGKRLADSNWKPGVGFLVKQITNPKTKLVLVKISGTRMSDMVAYIPALRWWFKPRPIKIKFGRPRLLKKAVDLSADPKTITRNLEKLYCLT